MALSALRWMQRARGFLLKSVHGAHLVAAIEALQFDNTFFTARVADIVLSGSSGTRTLRKGPE